MSARPSYRIAVLAGLVAILSACSRHRERASVTVAVTPEVAATGVARMLADAFSAESKVATNVIVTEARGLPDLVRSGKVDATMTTLPELKRQLQNAQLVRLMEIIGYDDYLLVGPRRDPARTKDAKTAAEALRRIARRDRAFCAPVDVPELSAREALLWDASPASPSNDRRYRSCHGSAADVLREASRRGAYTLTDRATFERVRSEIALVPLLQRTPLLHNDVTVLLSASSSPRPNADWFVQWMMSYRGREAIERYRFGADQRLFFDER
jgi:tungstate transport system substrate-binding protein